MRGLTLLLLSTLLVVAFSARLSWWTSSDCTGDEHDLSIDFSKCVGIAGNGAMANESNNQITFCTYDSSNCDAATADHCETGSYGTCKKLTDSFSYRITAGASQATFGVIGVVITLAALFM